MERNEIIEFVDKIDSVDGVKLAVMGGVNHEEGETLYNLARNCTGKGVIVEIGSWKGESAIWLGHGSKKGNKVRIYAVDPHTGSPEHREKWGKVWTFDEFKKNIATTKVDDIITPILKTSEEAAKTFDKPVELIFIDGNHDYNFVKSDFELWFPKVVEGGVMSFHDSILHEGPRRVVEEYVYKSSHFRNVRISSAITYAEKVRQNSLKDKVVNRYALLVKRIYRIGGALPIPEPIKALGRKVIRIR